MSKHKYTPGVLLHPSKENLSIFYKVLSRVVSAQLKLGVSGEFPIYCVCAQDRGQAEHFPTVWILPPARVGQTRTSISHLTQTYLFNGKVPNTYLVKFPNPFFMGIRGTGLYKGCPLGPNRLFLSDPGIPGRLL